MYYFPRPVLAGSNIARTTFGTIRGNTRRNDPDGTSTVPYFPSLNGKTLNITAIATPYVVTFTSDSFADAITAINTALGGNGIAFDSDGCIGLRAGDSFPGTLGSIAVTGGSARTILGFSYNYGNGTLVANVGGDIERAPEGRIGNNLYTTFPTNRENLTAEVVQRGFASIAANTDFLYADAARSLPVLKPVSLTSSSDGRHFTVNAPNTKVFTGGNGTLSNISNKEALAPYFVIIDPSTKQPSASRVVAVVQGTPLAYPGAWPFADTAGWRANDGGNVLGVDLTKVSGSQITEIHNGRYVVCPTAAFQTNGVMEGDFVEIIGSTNNTPRNNNGYNWAVESVQSETTIVLRPMSRAELDSIGAYPAGGVDNVLELNDYKTVGTENYGLLSVKTGNAMGEVNLVVDPPLSPSTLYEVWFAQPSQRLFTKAEDFGQQAGPLARTLVSDLDPAQNGLLSDANVIGLGPGPLVVSSFYVRWHGRVYRVPATQFTVPGGTTVLTPYWEEATNTVKLYDWALGDTSKFVGQSPQDASASPSSTFGVPLARVVVTAGLVTSIIPFSKKENGNISTITVGYGGQFATLVEAAAYLGTLPPRTFTTARPYYEVILLSDMALVEGTVPSFPNGTVIRGANSEIRITSSATLSTTFGMFAAGDITLENLTIANSGTAHYFLGTTAATTVTLRNVNSDLTLGTPGLFRGIITGYSFLALHIEKCIFGTTVEVVDKGAGASLSNAYVRDCQFLHINDATPASGAPHVFNHSSCSNLHLKNTRFIGWKNESGYQNPTIFDFGGSSSTSTIIEIDACSFTSSAFGDMGWFFDAGSNQCRISDCYISVSGNAGVNKQSLPTCNVVYSNCKIETNAFNAGSDGALRADQVLNCDVNVLVDTVSNYNATLIKARVVEGCRITGYQANFYIDGVGGTSVRGNQISDQIDAVNGPLIAAMFIRAGREVADNIIDHGSGFECNYGIIVNSSVDSVRIHGNRISMVTTTGTGIYVDAAVVSALISGNQISARRSVQGGAGATWASTVGNVLYSVEPHDYALNGAFSDNWVSGPFYFGSGEEVEVSNCTFLGNQHTSSTPTIQYSNCNFVEGVAVSGGLASAKIPFSSCITGADKAVSLFGCAVSDCVFAGTLTIKDCTVSSSTFGYGVVIALKTLTTKSSAFSGCDFSVNSITDSLEGGQTDLIFSGCKGPTTSMSLSNQVPKLVVDGCSFASIAGLAYPTYIGPQRISITNSSTSFVSFKTLRKAYVATSTIAGSLALLVRDDYVDSSIEVDGCYVADSLASEFGGCNSTATTATGTLGRISIANTHFTSSSPIAVFTIALPPMYVMAKPGGRIFLDNVSSARPIAVQQYTAYSELNAGLGTWSAGNTFTAPGSVFVANDVGRAVFAVSGSASYRIATYISGTQITVRNLDGSDPGLVSGSNTLHAGRYPTKKRGSSGGGMNTYVGSSIIAFNTTGDNANWASNDVGRLIEVGGVLFRIALVTDANNIGLDAPWNTNAQNAFTLVSGQRWQTIDEPEVHVTGCTIYGLKMTGVTGSVVNNTIRGTADLRLTPGLRFDSNRVVPMQGAQATSAVIVDLLTLDYDVHLQPTDVSITNNYLYVHSGTDPTIQVGRSSRVRIVGNQIGHWWFTGMANPFNVVNIGTGPESIFARDAVFGSNHLFLVYDGSAPSNPTVTPTGGSTVFDERGAAFGASPYFCVITLRPSSDGLPV